MPGRFRSTGAWLAICGVVLALGTAGAFAARSHGRHTPRPRLIVRPSRLAPAERIAPGDRVERLIELRARGRFAAIYFKATAPVRSALDSDPQHGLRVAIDSCPKRWRKQGARFVCGAKPRSVLASRRIVGRAKLRRIGLRGGRPVHLRLVITFPADAGTTLEGQSSKLRYAFVGVAGR